MRPTEPTFDATLLAGPGDDRRRVGEEPSHADCVAGDDDWVPASQVLWLSVAAIGATILAVLV